MKSKCVFTKQIKEMAKICFNTLKIIVVKHGEIWFPWRNIALQSLYYTVLDPFKVKIFTIISKNHVIMYDMMFYVKQLHESHDLL